MERDYVKEFEALCPLPAQTSGPICQGEAKALLEAYEKSLADPEYGQAEHRAFVARMDERKIRVEGELGLGICKPVDTPKCDYCGAPANGHRGQGIWDCGNCDKGKLGG